MVLKAGEFGGFKLPQEEFDLRPYGVDGSVYIRAMNQYELEQVSKRSNDGDESGAQRQVIATCTVDDNGDPVWSEEQVKGAPLKLVRDISDRIAELSNVGDITGDETDEGKP